MKPNLPIAIQFRQDSILSKGRFKEALSEIFGSTFWTLTEDSDTSYVEAAHEPDVDVVSALEAAGAIQMRSVDEPSDTMAEDRTASNETKPEVRKKHAKKAKKKNRVEVKFREKSVRKSHGIADEKSTDEPVKAICNFTKPRKPSEGVGRAMAVPPN